MLRRHEAESSFQDAIGFRHARVVFRACLDIGAWPAVNFAILQRGLST